MAEKINLPEPVTSFEYMLFEGDPDHLTPVVATPTQISPWIEPSDLKLKHRIGRGIFGDVWLATRHQSTRDFEEHHEVAVKLLHPLKEDLTQIFVDKFEKLFFKLRECLGVGWLYGVSIINGQICIAMKFYEGSIADRIGLVKGGKLQLSDVLRYGIDLAKGIQELHSIGLLVLNIKPSNFLLNEQDHAVLGDFGMPFLLHRIPLRNSEMALRLGTPNYMAPEQWEPEVRGPISVETDSWGFGCSIVEMLTGVQPFFGKSIQEIYQSVVIKQEKPHILNGLPPAVENVIHGCFQYDLRNRPVMEDILSAFQSSLNALSSDGGWDDMESRGLAGKSIGGYTAWYLLKDHLQVGDTVRSKKPLNAYKHQNINVSKGIVVGPDNDADRSGYVLVNVSGMQNPVRVQESTLERVTFGFAMGDWVCLKEEQSGHSPVGILHSVQRDGSVSVGFVGFETLWSGSYTDIQKAKGYRLGQFVRLKTNVVTPRFEWPRKRGGWATGRITHVLPNGGLLVGFPGRFVFGDESNSFLADPAETELVSFDTCPGVVDKYQLMEDFHWAVRPLTIALGLFTATKLTLSVGRTVSMKLRKCRKSGDDNNQDRRSGDANWIPPPVANILFKEGAAAVSAR